MFDRLITGARVFDGNAFIDGHNVGITGDRIAYFGPACPAARERTDAAGFWLTPSFIDTHTHADFHCVNPDNDGLSALSQGVATVVVGNCGFSATPVTPLPSVVLLPGHAGHNVALPEHNRRLATGLPLDVSDLLGHSTLRLAVLGQARAARTIEIERMAGLLEEFLASGGLGLSVGLNYPEAVGYDRNELLALAKVLARFGRPLTCHIRDQGAGILSAVDEVASLGDETGCPVLVSHLRPISDRNDHLLPALLQRIERRDSLAMDLYPYVAGFTTLGWMFQHLYGRLPARDHLFPVDEVPLRVTEICIGSLEDVHIVSSQSAGVAGHTVAQVARMRGVEPGRVAQDLYIEDPACLCIYDRESTSEVIDQIICHPKCLIGSDGYLFGSGFRQGCHPRSFAAFTRFLTHYVRSGKISAQQGLARITSGAARFFGFNDRGQIAPGKRANLSLFALDDLVEQADFKEPWRASLGMREVIVGGRTAWNGAHPMKEARPGLRVRPGA